MAGVYEISWAVESTTFMVDRHQGSSIILTETAWNGRHLHRGFHSVVFGGLGEGILRIDQKEKRRYPSSC